MKRIIIISLGLIVLGSCQKALKDMDDYYPEIKTESVEVLDDGSVRVKGSLISEGASELEVIGFCMDTVDEPHMTTNQVLVNKSFEAIYSGFDIGRRYYFRAFAVNDHGYVYGNTLTLDSIRPAIIDAPCNPPMNTVSNGMLGQQNINLATGPSYSDNMWKMNAYASQCDIYLEFPEKPYSRVYKAVDRFDTPKADEVRMYFNMGNMASLKDGSPIYVTQLSATEYEITICDSDWSWNNQTLKFTTHFKTK